MRGLSRFASLLLVLSIILSVFTVFTFADDGKEEESESGFNVLVNRSFDEGWGIDNGMGVFSNKQLYTVDYEELADFTYNYFARIEMLGYVNSDENGYIIISADSSVNTGGMVLEYDIRTDCYTNVGQGYFMTPGSADVRTVQNFFTIKENVYYINNGYGDANKKEQFKVGDISKKWVHIANVYNFDQSKVRCTCGTRYDLDETASCPNDGCDSTKFNYVITIRTYFSYSDAFDYKNATEAPLSGDLDLDNTYYYDSYRQLKKIGEKPCINTFRLGLIGAGNDVEGQGFLVDNVKVYTDTDPRDEDGNSVPMDVRDDVTVEKYGYGSNVDENKSFTVSIKGSDGDSAVLKENSMIMKVGSGFLLANGVRSEIFKNALTGRAYGAPLKKDGIVYVPFEILLKATGLPVFVHDDGVQYDIALPGGATIITLYRDVAIVGGERVSLTAKPFMAQDPNDPDNTYPVVALKDIPTLFSGYYVTYDEMGLIGISDTPELFNRASDLDSMVALMKQFIFDDLSSEELYQRIEENTDGFTHPYLIADKEQFEFLSEVYEAHVAKTAGEAYDESYIDDDLYKMIKKLVGEADDTLKKYQTLPTPDKAANHTFLEYAYERDPGKYKLLAFEITNPFYGIKDGMLFTDSEEYDYAGPADENGDYWGKKGAHYNDGYDWAGDQSFKIEEPADEILNLALCYNVTGRMEYAELAYDIMISICDEDNWHHWLHKHFLATGSALMSLGLGYDWLYNVWEEIQEERSEEYNLAYITQKIYRKGIYYAYDICRYARMNNVATKSYKDNPIDKDGYYTGIWNWSKSEINWNGVCSSGIVIAAMAIIGEESKLSGVDFAQDDKDGVNRVAWCMENNLRNLCMYGLDQYAPDGSYIEGAGYWSYGTNHIAKLMWAVNTAVGDDLGLYETWGMDKTFYFAVHSEYSAYEGKGTKAWYCEWMFHDNGGGAQDTQMYFFAADMLGDIGLAAIRIDHLKNGKEITWEDMLGYKAEYKSLTLEDAGLGLDWRFEACEGVASRSSWETGGTYAGLMGGPNNFGNHGQMDSGAFMYADDGFAWLQDIGSDNYYIADYFTYGIRQFYYRNSAEGHNQVIFTSQQEELPFGQSYTGSGFITDFVSEDAGMYTIIDNTSAYGEYAKFARRGMLMTNSRETVVIQDEMSFKSAESVAWIAHTQASGLTLSDDKRTAYLYDVINMKREIIRVSIVSSDPTLKFNIMTCAIMEDGQDRLLEGTHLPSYSKEHGGEKERKRSQFRRLVIKAEKTLNFNCAIVIEDVSSLSSEMPVQYDWQDMVNWHSGAIAEAYTGKNSSTGADNSNVITNALMGDIVTYSSLAQKLLETGYAFSTRFSDFFGALVRANCAVNTYRPETFMGIEKMKAAYESYLSTIEYYRAYHRGVNSSTDVSVSISKGLCGL